MRSKFMIKWIFIAIPIMTLILGIINIVSAEKQKDYIETIGYITNIEQDTELTRSGRRIVWSYDIVWELDGVKHSRHVYKALSKPNEDNTVFYASPDGKTAYSSDSGVVQRTGIMFIIVSVILYLIGIVVRKRLCT